MFISSSIFKFVYKALILIVCKIFKSSNHLQQGKRDKNVYKYGCKI